MTQAHLRKERSAPKESVQPTEEVRKAGESHAAGINSAPFYIEEISHGETPPISGTDDEPAVRRWQDLIASSLALEEQAREHDRWNIRQSVPFLACLSGVLWALLIVGVLKVS